MKIKSSINVLKNLTVLFPFILIFISEILKVSFNKESVIIKIIAVLYMFLYVILYRKLHNNFVFSFLFFFPFFLYGIIHSFNIEAALTEGIRYLFPVSVLLYSFSIRFHFKLLLKAFIFFVIINDFFQIINYIYWLKGIDQ